MRDYARFLTGIPISDDIPESIVPSTQEVKRWTEGAQSAPPTALVEREFKLDLYGTAHSDWNRGACRIFVPGFLETHRYEPHSYLIIIWLIFFYGDSQYEAKLCHFPNLAYSHRNRRHYNFA